MGIVDILWMVFVLVGASYLFYRSFRKKKGGPCGCDGGSCCKK